MGGEESQVGQTRGRHVDTRRVQESVGQSISQTDHRSSCGSSSTSSSCSLLMQTSQQNTRACGGSSTVASAHSPWLLVCHGSTRSVTTSGHSEGCWTFPFY